jgi:hypothetical protein
MSQAAETWFPLFEFQKYLYRSYLLEPLEADPGGPVSLREWAKGELACGQAMNRGDGFSVSGTLSLAPGVTLAVELEGKKAATGTPARVTGKGTGLEGPTAGALYELSGLVHPAPSRDPGAAQVASIRGSVTAAKGPGGAPFDLARQPLGTVGSFVIVSLGPAG